MTDPYARFIELGNSLNFSGPEFRSFVEQMIREFNVVEKVRRDAERDAKRDITEVEHEYLKEIERHSWHLYGLLLEQKDGDPKINTYQYVVLLRSRIFQLCSEAMEALDRAGMKHCECANNKERLRSLVPGSKVSVLIPEKQDLWLISYQGPFEILEKKITIVDYIIGVKEKKEDLPR